MLKGDLCQDLATKIKILLKGILSQVRNINCCHLKKLLNHFIRFAYALRCDAFINHIGPIKGISKTGNNA